MDMMNLWVLIRYQLLYLLVFVCFPLRHKTTYNHSVTQINLERIYQNVCWQP